MREELLKGLTEEQLEKARACKSNEELIGLAKDEGIELTDEQLEAVAGGGCTTKPINNPKPTHNGPVCPRCGSISIEVIYDSQYTEGVYHQCNICRYDW